MELNVLRNVLVCVCVWLSRRTRMYGIALHCNSCNVYVHAFIADYNTRTHLQQHLTPWGASNYFIIRGGVRNLYLARYSFICCLTHTHTATVTHTHTHTFSHSFAQLPRAVTWVCGHSFISCCKWRQHTITCLKSPAVAEIVFLFTCASCFFCFLHFVFTLALFAFLRMSEFGKLRTQPAALHASCCNIARMLTAAAAAAAACGSCCHTHSQVHTQNGSWNVCKQPMKYFADGHWYRQQPGERTVQKVNVWVSVCACNNGNENSEYKNAATWRLTCCRCKLFHDCMPQMHATHSLTDSQLPLHALPPA